MIDRYEQFKEWFKHHPTDEDELDLIFAIGNLFKEFEEECVKKEKENNFLQFTIEEMYTHTNTLLLDYLTVFKNNQMSFAEFTLIKSVIMEIQAKFEEEVKND